MESAGAFPPPVAREAAALMEGYPGWWAVAGGWAVDLHLGRKTREHDDLEVAVLRRDLASLRRTFSGDWSYVEPHPEGIEEAGAVRPWGGDPLRLRVHQVAVDLGTARLGFVVDECEGGVWRYRRDPRIALPLAAAAIREATIPHLAPEVVLLFKSKHLRPKDQLDLGSLLPTIDGARRSWLCEAIALVDPGHPWVPLLDVSEG